MEAATLQAISSYGSKDFGGFRLMSSVNLEYTDKILQGDVIETLRKLPPGLDGLKGIILRWCMFVLNVILILLNIERK